MKQERSPGTGRRYPLTMICPIYRLARSSVYATLPGSSRGPTGKRGPKTRVSDAELVEEIRAVLAACPFHGPPGWPNDIVNSGTSHSRTSHSSVVFKLN